MPCGESRSSTASRIEGWSSATRTRIRCGLVGMIVPRYIGQYTSLEASPGVGYRLPDCEAHQDWAFLQPAAVLPGCCSLCMISNVLRAKLSCVARCHRRLQRFYGVCVTTPDFASSIEAPICSSVSPVARSMSTLAFSYPVCAATRADSAVARSCCATSVS
jgi:hypothetical protein